VFKAPLNPNEVTSAWSLTVFIICPCHLDNIDTDNYLMLLAAVKCGFRIDGHINEWNNRVSQFFFVFLLKNCTYVGFAEFNSSFVCFLYYIVIAVQATVRINRMLLSYRDSFWFMAK